MSPSDDVARVDGISYSYLDRFPALVDVSLAVACGERVALVGANGCGKSTLLKVLGGLLFPTKGAYHAFGREITERALEDPETNAAFRSRLGFVFQHADAQVFSPTVHEEIAFGPLHLGLPRDEVEARIDDLVAMLDLGPIVDRAPYQLSTGQKKRVAIASVLATSPEVLLFDEPTAALDPRTQHWLLGLLGDLHHAGKTTIVATHDLDALGTIADRCIVLGEDHRVIAAAPPAEVLADRDLLLAANLIHPGQRLVGG